MRAERKSHLASSPVPGLYGRCTHGIVGAVCRRDRVDVIRLLQQIDNLDARIAATAERACLDAVDSAAPGEGRPPLAALMQRETQLQAVGSQKGTRGAWSLRASLTRPDGTINLCTFDRAPSSCSVVEASRLGRKAGKQLITRAGTHFFS